MREKNLPQVFDPMASSVIPICYHRAETPYHVLLLICGTERGH